ncbi:amino acid permease [Nonomuraea sp. NN258]|uniref:amino acid permease n=1 Tax=Nonomuraea antri TaxID=2730852 RepID=UPI0015689F8F|nr:amino acid permease [Nonomuraea antri]NRQ37653.1 amino acid permease [Nonomuraea antri]
MGEPRPPAGGVTTTAREEGAPAAGSLGLGSAVALIVGNVVGTGIFLLPTSLAAFGTVSLVAMVVVTIGAVAMAMVFGRLGARIPEGGGPYAYAREAFGEFAGFWIAWSFWLTAWIGNAAIAVAWVGYVQYFARQVFGLNWAGVLGSIVIGLVGVWIPALVNLRGTRNAAAFQVVTTVLKFAPLLFVAVVGLFFVRTANFGAFNATHDNWVGAISMAGAVTLFIYSGVESVAIAAEKIKDPARNIGRASVVGVLACAVLYLLSTVAVMGTVPHGRLVNSTAPFADALNTMFGGSMGGVLMAACAIVSGIGALNGWTLLVAEMPMAAARDGMFPKGFGRVSRRGAPVTGILAGTILTSLMLLIGYASENAFNTIVLLASFTTVIPYFFSAAAQIFWLTTRTREVDRGRLGRDLVVAVLALLFAFWMAYGSGAEAVLGGTLMLLVGVPVYVWLKSQRGEYGPRDVRASKGMKQT